MRYAANWIERQLAHVEQNAVRRTYNHTDQFKDRVGMMKAWADWRDSLKAGAEVILIRREAKP